MSPGRHDLSLDNGRKWVLIFCESLAFQWALEAAFQAQGLPAKSMHGQTSSSDRQKIIRAFDTRPGSVLINCGVLVEGADLPSVSPEAYTMGVLAVLTQGRSTASSLLNLRNLRSA